MRLIMTICLSLSGLCYAQDSVEAVPVKVTSDAPIIVHKGSEVPVDGLLLSDELAIAVAKEIKSCSAERVALENDKKMSIILPVVVGVVAASAGVVGGVFIGKALK